jgi:hypothetical protein
LLKVSLKNILIYKDMGKVLDEIPEGDRENLGELGSYRLKKTN